MFFPRKEIVESIRKSYPVGCRIKLLKMNDIQAPPLGTKGTVTGVDDTGSLMVRWDNGSGLNVIYGEDEVSLLEEVTTICYEEKQTWENRQKALEFFLQAAAGCEGHEQKRYIEICNQLKDGAFVATDEGV